jgi:uncharacterized membrane protein YbaN (DUF454 family)
VQVRPVLAIRHFIEGKKEKTRIGKDMKRALLIILGCIGLVLGVIGAVLPIMPAFPFLLLAAVCFAKSSKRLNNWFVGTRLYKNNLESYVKGQGMTRKTKIRALIMITILMGVSFFMMRNVPVGQVILAAVWAFHIVYFFFVVKTRREESRHWKEGMTDVLAGNRR